MPVKLESARFEQPSHDPDLSHDFGYRYADNSPTNYTDPTGLSPFSSIGSLGSAIGSAVSSYISPYATAATNLYNSIASSPV